MIVDNYQSAADWLSRGKRKWERPLYTRGLALRRVPGTGNITTSSDIEVFCRWNQQTLVTYHADGTTTIQAKNYQTHWGRSHNPLYSWSTRTVYRDFANLRDVYQRKHKIHVVFQDAKNKPGKLCKCRRCGGSGLVDGWCQVWWCSYGKECTIQPRWEPLEGSPSLEHKHPCEHGQTQSHYIPRAETCSRCNGSGKAVYGAGYQSMLWDGSPLRLQQGILINHKPSELEKAIAAYVSIS